MTACMQSVFGKTFLAGVKIQICLPFWCRLIEVVLEKRLLNLSKCLSVSLIGAVYSTMPPSGLSIEQYSRDYRDETFGSHAC